MKLCRRAIHFIQVINEDGDVRVCGWLHDGGIIGRLTENSMEEIYHSKAAEQIREYHCRNDHSNCNPNACPYVANDNVEEASIEIDQVPQFPPTIYLAYENVCNYRCVMCTIPDCMDRKKQEERERKLDRIDVELEKVLPYVKNISANGLGELFASRHILKLLSEWKPLAPKEECSVTLETNGSLFNPKNWEKISNLGQYRLSVNLTVLSFEEETYQELSGTTLPISNLIDNLRFVKKLREEGVINYLEIATVYQEKNFRTLPEFTRRCLEEFGADIVRLRPFEPWRDPDMQEWYRDVRNKYHPHHREFLKVMEDPIFRHPKVQDWGGGKESGLGPEPYVRMRARYRLLEKIFCEEALGERLKEKIGNAPVVVYGMGVVGKAAAAALRENHEVLYCIDRAMHGQEYNGIPIYSVNQLEGLDRNVTVLISLDQNEDPVKKLLEREGYQRVYSLKEL